MIESNEAMFSQVGYTISTQYITISLSAKLVHMYDAFLKRFIKIFFFTEGSYEHWYVRIEGELVGFPIKACESFHDKVVPKAFVVDHHFERNTNANSITNLKVTTHLANANNTSGTEKYQPDGSLTNLTRDDDKQTFVVFWNDYTLYESKQYFAAVSSPFSSCFACTCLPKNAYN